MLAEPLRVFRRLEPESALGDQPGGLVGVKAVAKHTPRPREVADDHRPDFRLIE